MNVYIIYFIIIHETDYKKSVNLYSFNFDIDIEFIPFFLNCTKFKPNVKRISTFFMLVHCDVSRDVQNRLYKYNQVFFYPIICRV